MAESRFAIVDKTSNVVLNKILSERQFAVDTYGDLYTLVELLDNEICDIGSRYVAPAATMLAKPAAMVSDRFIPPPPQPRYENFRVELSKTTAYLNILKEPKNVQFAMMLSSILFHLGTSLDILNEMIGLWNICVANKKPSGPEITNLNIIASKTAMPFTFTASTGVITLK